MAQFAQKLGKKFNGDKFSDYILPHYSAHPARIYRTIVVILALSACFGHALIRLAGAIITAEHAMCTSRLGQVKNVLWAAQELLVCSRGPLVLAIVWIFEKKIASLKYPLADVLAARLYMCDQKILRRLWTISLAAYVAGGFLAFSMDVIWFMSYIWTNVSADSVPYLPYGLHVPGWMALVVWIIFATFPFALSQEVLRVQFVFGIIFRQGTMILNREIKTLGNKVTECSSLVVPEHEKVLRSMECVLKIEEILAFYHNLGKLADCFTEAFGVAYGAALAMDVSAMLSLVVTAMISAQDSEASSWLAVFSDILGVTVFAAYIGIFTLPMVSATSKVELTLEVFSLLKLGNLGVTIDASWGKTLS